MKLLNINEERLMRSGSFAVLVSLLTAAIILLPLFATAKNKDKNMAVNNIKVEDNLAFRCLTCTRAAIVYTSVNEGKCTFTIESKNGNEVLYSESLRSLGKTTRVFDFLNLEDGDYKIVTKKNGVRKERPFRIVDGELVYGGRVVVDPIFKATGTRAIIELPNENRKNVTVKVLDAKGEELYSAIERKAVYKNFEFSNMCAGDYTVLVSVDNDDYHFDYRKH